MYICVGLKLNDYICGGEEIFFPQSSQSGINISKLTAFSSLSLSIPYGCHEKRKKGNMGTFRAMSERQKIG